MSQERADGSPEGLAEKGADLLIFVADYLRRVQARIDKSVNRPTGFRGPYGFVRRYFKSRSERYSKFRRYLNQARVGVPYDIYLTRAFYYSVAGAVLGLFGGGVLTYLLWASGALESLTSPVRLSGSTASFAETYSTAIQGTAITVAVALTFGFSIWAYLYYYPRLKADQRRRSINIMLPHSIVFMYALKYGGLSIVDAMRELAESDDVYDEVAKEFDTVVRDMDEFGSPLPIALRNARNLTPSDSMRRFFDDLLSTIDSGGDTTKFLYNEGERYYEKAKDEQENFIQGLGIMGEIYTTLFIAAPLLFIIILLVMSFIGAETLTAIAAVTYVGIPLGVVCFGLLLHTMSKPYSWETGEVLGGDDENTPSEPEESVTNDPRYRGYRRAKIFRSVRSFVDSPLAPVYRRPALSLVVSVPAALLTMAVLSSSDVASFENMLTEPIWTTTVLIVVPILVAVTPLSLLHEKKKAKVRSIVSRFPEKVNAVANANDMGMSLRDGFNHVSKRGSTEIDKEFGRVSNDISWKNNTEQALIDCANRLRIAQVSRSMNLISKASRTTGDLNKILEVAARDTANEYRMKKQRAQEMSGYIAVIIISFLVYLSVILMLDKFYLVPLYEAIPAPEPGAVGPQTEIGSLTEIPIETYRTLFFHSSLVLAFGNGMLAGKMGENDLVAGLKYGIGFVLVTVVAFWVIA